MILDYNPQICVRKNYRRSANLQPVDVEVSAIIDHAISLKCHVEETTVSKDLLEIKFVEANNHTAIVQIFAGPIQTCSCEQYCKHQCGCCKHLALLKYFDIAPSFCLTAEERDFSREIRKNRSGLKPSKDIAYKIYESLKDETVLVGSGPLEVESVSYVTKQKHILNSVLSIYQPVTLENPYKLNSDIVLFDYQHDILQKMLSAKRAICSMIMGSGKTLSAIAGMKHIGSENVLIVCPKSVASQWKREIKRAIGLDAAMLSSKSISEFADSEERYIGICTYQTLSRNAEILSKVKYDLIIADEIQFIRNDETKTWTSFKALQSEYFWGLSGTVIENRLDDLYNIMEVIAPGLLGVKWKFDSKFKKIKSIHRTKVLYENEIKNQKELQALLARNVFSYDNLNLKPPNVIKSFISFDKDAKLIHDDYMHKANLLVSKSLSSSLTLGEQLLLQSYYLRARQCCNSLELVDKKTKGSVKTSSVLDLIEDICVKQNEKLVLYSEWTTMLDIVEREIGSKVEFVRFDGSMSVKQRQFAMDTFKNDARCKIFCSSDAGGLGIDGLQLVCNNMVHVELPWNPAKLDQRICRLNRLLQTKTVNVYYFITQGSIEAKIDSTLALKRDVRMQTLFDFSDEKKDDWCKDIEI